MIRVCSKRSALDYEPDYQVHMPCARICASRQVNVGQFACTQCQSTLHAAGL